MIGIMQGRLLAPEPDRFQAFPRKDWRAEFSSAADAGLSYIEWIYDAYGEDANPFRDEKRLGEIAALSHASGVTVRALCADYFMDFPFLRCSPEDCGARQEILHRLVRHCCQAGIGRIVLPFVDASKIEAPADEDVVVAVLNEALPIAEQAGVELHLETALGPEAFARLMARVPHALVRVNYDSGNSSSLGYRVQDEFAAYGDRIGSVHIKDRVLGGGTVPLGAGDADFDALFEALREIAYTGDFTLQAARGVSGDEVNWARQNVEFVRARL